MPESGSILSALLRLGSFQYCSNHGNIGDLLIDIATRQFFRRHPPPVAGLFAGCRVYFLDNNYGKLSGIYHQSLSDHPRACLLPHSELSKLFPEILSLVRK